MILVNISPLHNSPSFKRAADNTYAQIVYAGKSTDVSDVMVNGKWLMRDHELLTLNEEELLGQAAEVAQKIDMFLVEREQSVLSKLIALGGSMEQESFEVQVKVRITDDKTIVQALKQPGIEIVRYRHYRQHDNYFGFDDASQGRLRYREDDFLDPNGTVTNTRARLTLLGQKREDKFEHDVLLSRSRFFAPAAQGLRFYREYFKPRGGDADHEGPRTLADQVQGHGILRQRGRDARACLGAFCRDQVPHLEPQRRRSQSAS